MSLPQGQPWNCSICEFLVGVVNAYIKDNGTMDKIEGHVLQICSFLPSPFNDECSTSARNILHDLERGVDIQEYCDKANGVKCDKPKNGSLLVQDLSGNPSPWECKLCMTSMDIVFKSLDKEQVNMHNYLYSVCDRMPSVSTGYQCYKYVNANEDKIIRTLVDELLKPVRICAFAQIC